MTATDTSTALEYGNASTEAIIVDHNDKLNGPRPIFAESLGACMSSQNSSWFLPDRTARHPVLQRSQSVSNPSTTLTGNEFVNYLMKAPAAESNKENGLCGQSSSELGNRFHDFDTFIDQVMTATDTSTALEYGKASTEAIIVDDNDKLNEPRPIFAESLGACMSSQNSSWFLPDRTARHPVLQRSQSVSNPSTTLTGKEFVNYLIKAPAADSEKDNGLCGQSSSELENRLHLSCLVSIGAGSQVNVGRYKTELCRPFQDNGICKYGDKCQFAHGMHELRSLSRHPKYKTELCRTYHTVGFCRYGPRCHFIHSAEEYQGLPPLSAFNKVGRPHLQHSFSFSGFPSQSMQDSPSSVTPLSIFHSSDQNPSTLPFTTIHYFHSTSASPTSPTNSLSDQDSSQSSVGSHSGSDSPLLDGSRRLPIFSRLSITDD